MPDFSLITFRDPHFFWLFLLLPVLITWYILRNKMDKPELTLSTTLPFLFASRTFKQRTRHSLFLFRLLGFSLFTIAMARPQSGISWKDVTTEGIDIVLSLDISGSMLAEDFQPNRIEAAKKISMNFIDERPNDRMGLVIFSGESFTQCPLTTDHSILKNLFSNIKSGMIEDGTAIGMGIATAVNRLKTSEAKSKVIILLTDGVNNSGLIAPQTAADIASGLGIRIYTIGVGTRGMAPYPFRTPFGGIQYQNIPVEIDEPGMQNIAESTDGKYFRATDNKKLKEIFKEIDKLEKTKIEVTEYQNRKEEFLPFLLTGSIFFFLEIFLRFTFYKSFP